MSRKTIPSDYSTEDEAKRVYQYFSKNREGKTGDEMFDRVPNDHNQVNEMPLLPRLIRGP